VSFLGPNASLVHEFWGNARCGDGCWDNSGHLTLGANLHLSCLVCWQQTLAVVVYLPPPPIKYRLHKFIPKLQQQ
jgi:hypothetical protein